MNRTTKFRVAIAAAGVILPVALAQAYEENIISTAQTGYFQYQASLPKSNADEYLAQHMHVTKTPLLWTIVTYDNDVAPGAQGPVREEWNPQANSARMAEQTQLERSFYPIGARNTP